MCSQCRHHLACCQSFSTQYSSTIGRKFPMQCCIEIPLHRLALIPYPPGSWLSVRVPSQRSREVDMDLKLASNAYANRSKFVNEYPPFGVLEVGTLFHAESSSRSNSQACIIEARQSSFVLVQTTILATSKTCIDSLSPVMIKKSAKSLAVMIFRYCLI